jgi:hypothetical protein
MKSPPSADTRDTDGAADDSRSILAIVGLAFALTVGPAVLITLLTSSCFVSP